MHTATRKRRLRGSELVTLALGGLTVLTSVGGCGFNTADAKSQSSAGAAMQQGFDEQIQANAREIRRRAAVVVRKHV